MESGSRMCQSSSVSGSKDGIKTRRQCPIYTGTRTLQTDDGQEYFRETICSRSHSNDGGHFCKPHSFSNLYTKQCCRYVFFFSFLISEGKDEVKKVQFFN